ncbi:MAG: nuclear transport factor 2 family protein [Alphaproteobacteria bacterium]
MYEARADVTKIEELENKRYDAMLNADIHVLNDLLHENLIYSHSTGGLDTKEIYLNALRDKVSIYKSVKRDDQTVRITGDIGLVFNHVQIHAEHKGSELRLDNRLLAVWTRDKGIWRLLAIQSGAIPKQID